MRFAEAVTQIPFISITLDYDYYYCCCCCCCCCLVFGTSQSHVAKQAAVTVWDALLDYLPIATATDAPHYIELDQCDQMLDFKSRPNVSKSCLNNIHCSFYINWFYQNSPKVNNLLGYFCKAQNFKNRPIWSHWTWSQVKKGRSVHWAGKIDIECQSESWLNNLLF